MTRARAALALSILAICWLGVDCPAANCLAITTALLAWIVI